MDVKVAHALLLLALLNVVSTQTTYTWEGGASNDASQAVNWNCAGPECGVSAVPTGAPLETVAFQACVDQTNLIDVSTPANVAWGQISTGVDSCPNITLAGVDISINGATPGSIQDVKLFTRTSVPNELTWVNSQSFDPECIIVTDGFETFRLKIPRCDIPLLQMGPVFTEIELEHLPGVFEPEYAFTDVVANLVTPGFVDRAMIVVIDTSPVTAKLIIQNIYKSGFGPLQLESDVSTAPLTIHLANIEATGGEVILTPTTSPNQITGQVSISASASVSLSEDSLPGAAWSISADVTGPGDLKVHDNTSFTGSLQNLPIRLFDTSGLTVTFDNQCANDVSVTSDPNQNPLIDYNLSGACSFSALGAPGSTATVTTGGDFIVDVLTSGTYAVSANACLTIKASTGLPTPITQLASTSNLKLEVAQAAKLDIPQDLIVTPETGATISFISGNINVFGADPWNGADVMLNIEGSVTCFQEAPVIPLLTVMTGEISKNFEVGTIKFVGGSVVNSSANVSESAVFAVSATFDSVDLTIGPTATAEFQDSATVYVGANPSSIVINGAANAQGVTDISGNAVVENSGTLELVPTANLIIPSYSQTGTLTVNIDNANAGRITCSTTAILKGTLNVASINPPNAVTSYTIVDCSQGGNIPQMFTTLQFDNAAFAFVEQTLNTDNQLVITVTPLPPARCTPGDSFDFITPGVYQLVDFPAGGVAPPTYGLRLDGLLGKKDVVVFSFEQKGSFVTLEFNGTHPLRISGTVYGGKIKKHKFYKPRRYFVDFTYRSVQLEPGKVLNPVDTISSGRITDIEKQESYTLVVSPNSPPLEAFFIEKGFRGFPNKISGTGWVDHSGKPHVYASDWLFTLGKCTDQNPKPVCNGHFNPQDGSCTCTKKQKYCQCIGTGDCFCGTSKSCFCAPAINQSCFCEGSKNCEALVLGDGFVEGGEAKEVDAVVEAGFVDCDNSDKCKCSSLNPISAFCEQGNVERKKWKCEMPNKSQCRVSVPAITHRFKCWKQKPMGKYEAVFEYTNTDKKDIKIKIGHDNMFEPHPKDRHQPTKFKPGTHEVKIQFKKKDVPFVWILNGNAEAVTLDPKKKCGQPVPPRVTPILFCVRKRIIFKGYVAYLGYESTYTSTKYIGIGKHNKFSGKKQNMGQPTVFFPGKSKPYPWEVFRVGTLFQPWEGNKLTWHLDGYALKFDKNSPRCRLTTNVRLIVKVDGNLNTDLQNILLSSLSDKMHIDQNRLTLAVPLDTTVKRNLASPGQENEEDLTEVMLSVQDLKQGESGISSEEALEILENILANEHDTSTDVYLLGDDHVSVVDGEVLPSGLEQRGKLPASHLLAYILVPLAFVVVLTIVGATVLIYRKRKDDIRKDDLRQRLITKHENIAVINQKENN